MFDPQTYFFCNQTQIIHGNLWMLKAISLPHFIAHKLDPSTQTYWIVFVLFQEKVPDSQHFQAICTSSSAQH